MHPNAHYLLEQCLLSIGQAYPENGELCLDVCRYKTGQLMAYRKSPTAPYLLIAEWLRPLVQPQPKLELYLPGLQRADAAH